jgi:predicted alpha/beta-hydrolase family hydrolase
MLGGVQELRIPANGTAVSASLHGEGPTVVVLGHGAGGTRRSPAMISIANAIADSGRRALLYNFLYTDRGGRRPDPPEVLEATTRAVGEFARTELGAHTLVHGGRSMGGRIASQTVAKGAPCDGLVFLAYPLHPPGKPDVLRDRHLPAIAAPMLFVQGTRDDFARWDLLAAVLERLGPRATLHAVEGGDHSFKVLKKSGRTAAEVEQEVQGAVRSWLAAHGL